MMMMKNTKIGKGTAFKAKLISTRYRNTMSTSDLYYATDSDLYRNDKNVLLSVY